MYIFQHFPNHIPPHFIFVVASFTFLLKCLVDVHFFHLPHYFLGQFILAIFNVSHHYCLILSTVGVYVLFVYVLLFVHYCFCSVYMFFLYTAVYIFVLFASVLLLLFNYYSCFLSLLLFMYYCCCLCTYVADYTLQLLFVLLVLLAYYLYFPSCFRILSVVQQYCFICMYYCFCFGLFTSVTV